MTWLTGLMNLRNVAILAGVLGLALIWHKSNKIEKLQDDIRLLDMAIDLALSANESNMVAIESQSKELKQCVYKRELNETQAIAELRSSEKRIIDLKKQYENARNDIPKIGNCTTPTVTADAVGWLQARHDNQD